MKIYLCGPINGCTDEECKNWREEAKKRFEQTIDPMRRDYRGIEAESVNEIVQLDKLDVDNCDLILANCPKPSAGTSMEILYAWERNTPVVVVIPEGTPISPWIKYHATKIVHSFADAYTWIENIEPDRGNEMRLCR